LTPFLTLTSPHVFTSLIPPPFFLL
jgi:hypothetical protein